MCLTLGTVGREVNSETAIEVFFSFAIHIIGFFFSDIGRCFYVASNSPTNDLLVILFTLQVNRGATGCFKLHISHIYSLSLYVSQQRRLFLAQFGGISSPPTYQQYVLFLKLQLLRNTSNWIKRVPLPGRPRVLSKGRQVVITRCPFATPVQISYEKT